MNGCIEATGIKLLASREHRASIGQPKNGLLPIDVGPTAKDCGATEIKLRAGYRDEIGETRTE